MQHTKFIFYKLEDKPLWARLFISFAGWLIPEIKNQYVLRDEIYYRSEYMRDVHSQYAREHAQLNRAITKKNKQIRQLQKDLDACIKERQNTFADGVKEGLARARGVI